MPGGDSPGPDQLELDEGTGGAVGTGTTITSSKNRRGLGSALFVTVAGSGGTILLSLVSGILTARLLGTYGRGQVAGIQSWTLTLAWLPAMGFGQALIYFQNKGRASPGQVLSTMLGAIPILGLIGVGVSQLALPLGFSAQTEETLELARIFMFTVPLILGTEAAWAVLMANHRFVYLSGIRLLQPIIYVAVLVVLWKLRSFTPFTVLAAHGASYGLTLAAAFIPLSIMVGLRKPSWSLAKASLGYGLRLQGVTIGSLVASRLDVMLLPAFVSAADLGFYAIAVNVASMVVTLFGSLQMVVFPVATSRGGGASVDVVERGMRLSLIGAGLSVVILAIVAPWVIPFVYGTSFAVAVEPMRLLLPGIVLWSATSVLGAGLQAAGRPGAASMAQIWGLVVTVAGLSFALPRFGINGAAITSSLAYATSFFFSWIALRRATRFRLRSALAPLSIWSDVGVLGQRMKAVLTQRALSKREGNS